MRIARFCRMGFATALTLALMLGGLVRPVAADPAPESAVYGVIELARRAPSCTIARSDLQGAMLRHDRAGVDAAIAFLRDRGLAGVDATGGQVTLAAGLCGTAAPMAAVEALLRLGSCALTPRSLRAGLREMDLSGVAAISAMAGLAEAGKVAVRGEDAFVHLVAGACADSVQSLLDHEAEALWQATAGGCRFDLDQLRDHYAARGMADLYLDAILAAAVTRGPDAAGNLRAVQPGAQLLVVGSAQCLGQGVVPMAWPNAAQSPRKALVGALRGLGCTVPLEEAGLRKLAQAAGLADVGELVEAALIAAAAGDLQAGPVTAGLTLSPAACAQVVEGAAEAKPAAADRDTALAVFRAATGCGVEPDALSAALGGEADRVVGAMFAAGEIALDRGLLVLSPQLCAPLADAARGREDAIDAFAAKACSMTPVEAETVLAPEGRAALEAMVASGEVRLVFGLLAMEAAVCRGEVAGPVEEAPVAAPVPPAAATADSATPAAFSALTEAEVDEIFATVVAAQGCEMDFSDGEALVRRLVEGVLEQVGQGGTQDEALLKTADLVVSAALERVTGRLERVGNSSKFRLQDCMAVPG